MTWIDERLFGWSRSAKRGTSAWSGLSGDETSRIGTPDDTDEEDTGDYDNVVGIVASSEDINAKLRSRQSSYADLQRFRHGHGMSFSNAGQSSASALDICTQDIDGLNPINRHRKRSESLSDNIAVGRIAAIDRREDFGHATQGLNSEISHRKECKP
jgi:glycerol-3-phosphate O-acyltransferase/dihydroxyacetone phosphate acyltransferase